MDFNNICSEFILEKQLEKFFLGRIHGVLQKFNFDSLHFQ